MQPDQNAPQQTSTPPVPDSTPGQDNKPEETPSVVDSMSPPTSPVEAITGQRQGADMASEPQPAEVEAVTDSSEKPVTADAMNAATGEKKKPSKSLVYLLIVLGVSVLALVGLYIYTLL